jgi:hypothetical protein
MKDISIQILKLLFFKYVFNNFFIKNKYALSIRRQIRGAQYTWVVKSVESKKNYLFVQYEDVSLHHHRRYAKNRLRP